MVSKKSKNVSTYSLYLHYDRQLHCQQVKCAISADHKIRRSDDCLKFIAELWKVANVDSNKSLEIILHNHHQFSRNIIMRTWATYLSWRWNWWLQLLLLRLLLQKWSMHLHRLLRYYGHNHCHCWWLPPLYDGVYSRDRAFFCRLLLRQLLPLFLKDSN